MQQRTVRLTLFLAPIWATVLAVLLAKFIPAVKNSESIVWGLFLLPLPWVFSFLSEEGPGIGRRLALAFAYYVGSLISSWVIGWVAIGMILGRV